MTRLRYRLYVANKSRYPNEVSRGTSTSLDALLKRVPQLCAAGFSYGEGVRECTVRVTYGAYGRELLRLNIWRDEFDAMTKGAQS